MAAMSSERRGLPFDAVPTGLWVAGFLAGIALVIVTASQKILDAFAPLSSVIIGIGVGLLLTAFLAPLIDRLDRWRVPRFASASLALILFVGTIVGLIWIAGSQLSDGLTELVDSMTAALDALQTWLRDGPLGITGEKLGDYLDRAREWATSNSGTIFAGALRAGNRLSTFLVTTLLALISTLFFLAEGRAIWIWFIRLLPSHTRQPVYEASRRGWVTVRAYVRTQVVVAAVDAAGIGIGAAVLGLPLVVPLSLVVFLTAFVPVVGAVASGMVVVLIGWFSQGMTVALIMLAIVIAVQQLESNVLQPVLMGKAVELHPWAVLIGVTVGSYLMGIAGAVFSVPIMAMANVMILYLRGNDRSPQLGEDPIDEPTEAEAETPADAR